MIGFIGFSPCFHGDGEIVPNVAQKCDGALIWSIVITRRLTRSTCEKLENILSKEG